MKKEDVRILYIDDEASFRRHYTIYLAQSAIEAREILDNNEINIIITDERMPVTTGVEFLTSIVNDYPNPIRMMLTGYANLNTVIRAVNDAHIYKYLTKPIHGEDLKVVIDEAYNT